MEIGATMTETPSSWIHPDSRESGRFWMKNTIRFKKAKLTSDPRTAMDRVSRWLNLGSVTWVCGIFAGRFAVDAHIRAPNQHL